ncbi:MAG: hypothetical protein K6E30_07100, partial [Lachnospiraceae bacterium]|nr:hypothetical protein [Lachnospiraceae bacterium]
VIVYPDDEAEEPDDEEPEDFSPETADQAAEFDNSMDSIDLPAGVTDETIDDETAEEIQTRGYILREEIKDENFHMYEILHDANERIVMETGEDDLPEDYGEQEDLSVDENGNLLGYEEYIEHAQEAEREKEAEEEKKIQMAQENQEGAADGEEAYVSLPINFFFRKIGFPVRRKQPMDPVILAYGNLGANIVYQAAEDYITTLRMLWSGEYDERLCNRLVVQKWQLETFIGSRIYWQFTSISPERILDQCWKTARRKAEVKIERANKRTVAGVEDGIEG